MTTKHRKAVHYNDYIKILSEELLTACGCTEPIAIAYTAAYARKVLGSFPDSLVVEVSGNIIKNAMGAIIPGTKDLKGALEAAVLGAVAGQADRTLEVLIDVTGEDAEKVKQLLKTDFCTLKLLETPITLHIVVTANGKDGKFARVELKHTHINIVKVETEKGVVFEKDGSSGKSRTDRSVLSIAGILEFAKTVDLDDVRELLKKQIDYNLAISMCGMEEQYGLGIGKMIASAPNADLMVKMKAHAAAGSDARMGGCSLPVVINSGSGNQGMTISIPLIIYAREKGMSEERLYRALLAANLVPIHLKSGIGYLSAFCGAVTAACGTGTGLGILNGATDRQIEDTITNVLANVSGIICDGAKASCAIKIASCIDAAIMAYNLALQGKVFTPETGILKNDVEETIKCIGRIAREGMYTTDRVILKEMTGIK